MLYYELSASAALRAAIGFARAGPSSGKLLAQPALSFRGSLTTPRVKEPSLLIFGLYSTTSPGPRQDLAESFQAKRFLFFIKAALALGRTFPYALRIL